MDIRRDATATSTGRQVAKPSQTTSIKRNAHLAISGKSETKSNLTLSFPPPVWRVAMAFTTCSSVYRTSRLVLANPWQQIPPSLWGATEKLLDVRVKEDLVHIWSSITAEGKRVVSQFKLECSQASSSLWVLLSSL